MRILNLYAGIGGNRKLWGDEHEITAVENVPEIAKVYKDLFPKDEVIVADAHQYLLEHRHDHDFIWSSPPCPTHSDIRRVGVQKGQYEAKYPDMTLYQEIILLKYFGPKRWVVENVQPYYEPLIPAALLGRHLFWSNFLIPDFPYVDDRTHDEIRGNSVVCGFDLSKYDISDKRKILRNMVNPDLGKWVFEWGLKEDATLF